MLIFDAVMADPQSLIRNALRFGHFFGLALGLGTATLMDFLIARFFVTRQINKSMLDLFSFCAHMVSLGLVILWITGIGFLAFYWHFDPENLTNPKIHAKIAIVGVLTLNGLIIHRTVLPFLLSQQGKRLFEDVAPMRAKLLLTTASISAVSWYCPLIIANLPQLNFVVPMFEILSAYAAILVTVLVCGHLFLGVIGTPREESSEPAGNQSHST